MELSIYVPWKPLLGRRREFKGEKGGRIEREEERQLRGRERDRWGK